MSRTTKRRRTHGAGADGTLETETPRCLLQNLPLELLAEVLSYTPSTRDVLALSRTSRYFCSVFVNNPATEFIWRHARARYVLDAIPDPFPGLAEATYAALLFDSGVCEVCGQKTHMPYHSYALRARICEASKACLRTWRTTVLHQVTEADEIEFHDIIQWIPRVERTDDFYAGKTFVRMKVWEDAITEYENARSLGPDAVSAYVETKQTLADALPAKLEFYRKLVKWADTQEQARIAYTQLSVASAEAHAAQIGCTKWEILQSPTYSSIYHAKVRCLERWIEQEFDLIKETVVSEIAAQKQKKQLRDKEQTLQEKRSGVEAEYARLKSLQPKQVLPSLSEFRKLSVVKAVEASSSKKDPSLTDPFVASILEENLQQWRDAARAALAAVLGFPGWKPMNKRRLHPVDRLTARFRCKRCDAAGKGIGKDGGMDFASACEHVCAHLSKKARSKQRWSAEDFVPDQRAINALSSVLELCGTKPEDADSFAIADSVGDRVRCASCSLNMDVRSVARHCQRHENPAFTLITASEWSEAQALEHGLTATLLSKSPSGKSERDKKIYCCRLCNQHPTSRGTSATAETGQAAGAGNGEPKSMCFNGLRSHLKEKHGVETIADEDFFRQKESEVTGMDSDST
ncbi:hypothetical protein BV20DRAFT_951546 [Pilatotrama ljubarskyi]|nr:hypothetical protein BV20DRAFT_951546 [Pilatotrama ljubarskyi]